MRGCVFNGKHSKISFFKRDLKLGVAAHGSQGEVFHSNLQSLAEPCQHGASPADRLSAGLMLSSANESRFASPDCISFLVPHVTQTRVTKLHSPLSVCGCKQYE